MIPKIIHYCWFGGNPLPPLAVECIASWKKYFPGYEIKEWNESNFNVNIIPYTAEAYKLKKYAFVSDYARFWILNQYGGVYFDTDVEVIRPMDEILEQGAFIGFERNPDRWGEGLVNPGLGMAAKGGMRLVETMLTKYESIHFINEDGTLNVSKTVVHHTTEVLNDMGLKQVVGIQNVDGIYIYPSEYFAPIDFVTKRLHVSENTHSIHRYMASWEEKKDRSVMDVIKHYMPEFVLLWYNRLKLYCRR